jgi:hypothetical protein
MSVTAACSAERGENRPGPKGGAAQRMWRAALRGERTGPALKAARRSDCGAMCLGVVRLGMQPIRAAVVAIRDVSDPLVVFAAQLPQEPHLGLARV